jgi:hypothetical protein
MTARGVGSALKRFSGHIGWAFGKLSGGVEGVSRHTRFEVGDGFKIDFGMTCGVGIC